MAPNGRTKLGQIICRRLTVKIPRIALRVLRVEGRRAAIRWQDKFNNKQQLVVYIKVVFFLIRLVSRRTDQLDSGGRSWRHTSH